MTMTPITPKPLSPTATQGRNPNKFAFEKSTSGGVTYLTLRGVLDQAFDGKKLAAMIHTPKVVVSLRHVRRFASWGMSEWMDFLQVNAARDLYLVECSTYAMSQINLVTGLLGHAKLVSFHASYRCGSCGEAFASKWPASSRITPARPLVHWAPGDVMKGCGAAAISARPARSSTG